MRQNNAAAASQEWRADTMCAPRAVLSGDAIISPINARENVPCEMCLICQLVPKVTYVCAMLTSSIFGDIEFMLCIYACSDKVYMEYK